MSKDSKNENNLVHQHAFQRLAKVEKEQRRAYKKERQPFAWQQLIMLVLLAIVLATMVYTLF